MTSREAFTHGVFWRGRARAPRLGPFAVRVSSYFLFIPVTSSFPRNPRRYQSPRRLRTSRGPTYRRAAIVHPYRPTTALWPFGEGGRAYAICIARGLCIAVNVHFEQLPSNSLPAACKIRLRNIRTADYAASFTILEEPSGRASQNACGPRLQLVLLTVSRRSGHPQHSPDDSRTGQSWIN
ncbi:hypothetical protein OH76DRAFT_788729 [Lentinus brumalis]|uniref:Uncharacterized protein n=1 Tax=Lentinus brumalis TaxID=2498619 RepID=A0A371D404_9APHY|nr:hypothetical protein OH76DRAFT_788729 [Polyporus brumalis]